MKIDLVSIAIVKNGFIDFKTENVQLLTKDDAKRILVQQIGSKNIEHVAIICLDINFQIINFSVVGIGAIDSVRVSVSQICKIALLSNASRIIVGHNHPNGILKVTDEDINVTRSIASACKLFGIKLEDSIIVNPSQEAISIREELEKHNVE